MPSVNRSTLTDAQWASWEPVTPAAAPPPPKTADLPRAAPDVWGADSRLERAARASIGQLHPGDRLQLNLKAELKGGESLGFDTDANVERQKDGSITVELNAKADVGIGASVVGSARVGIAAGTKFHFQSAAQAADFIDAFAKEGALLGSHLDGVANGLRAMGVKDDLVDAPERLASHLGNISELKGDLVGTVKVGEDKALFGFQELSASADLQMKRGFKVDFEKGTFTRTDSVSVGGQSKLKLPILNMSAGAKGTLSASATWKLSPEQLRDFKAGRLTPDDVARKLSEMPAEVSVKCELEVSEKGGKLAAIDTKEKLSIEFPLDTAKLGSLDPQTTLNELSRRKWKAEFDIGSGLGGKVDAKAASLELSGTYRHKETLQGEYDLNTGLAALRQRSTEAGDNLKAIDTRRALVNLR